MTPQEREKIRKALDLGRIMTFLIEGLHDDVTVRKRFDEAISILDADEGAAPTVTPDAARDALEWLKLCKVTLPDVGVLDQIRYVEHVSNVKKTIRALLADAVKCGV